MHWLAKELVTLREESGLSQNRAALLSDLHHASIQRWESGNQIPQVASVEKLLKVYGYEIELVKKG